MKYLAIFTAVLALYGLWGRIPVPGSCYTDDFFGVFERRSALYEVRKVSKVDLWHRSVRTSYRFPNLNLPKDAWTDSFLEDGLLNFMLTFRRAECP